MRFNSRKSVYLKRIVIRVAFLYFIYVVAYSIINRLIASSPDFDSSRDLDSNLDDSEPSFNSYQSSRDQKLISLSRVET